MGVYFFLKTMRPLERSYGVNSTSTVSPSIRLMKFFRIFPEIYARTMMPPPQKSCESFTSNIPPGSVFRTEPSTSILSSFDIYANVKIARVFYKKYEIKQIYFSLFSKITSGCDKTPYTTIVQYLLSIHEFSFLDNFSDFFVYVLMFSGKFCHRIIHDNENRS